MAKKRSSDPAMRELERELQANTQALKDAYLRFDYVCDNDLVESCIFEFVGVSGSIVIPQQFLHGCEFLHC